ncbi:MAG: choice-of-anchor J domain-containing protein [Prevotella sp.]|nr:choice-of-anchor J domain-containing protein [Prevotella sp.]
MIMKKKVIIRALIAFAALLTSAAVDAQQRASIPNTNDPAVAKKGIPLDVASQPLPAGESHAASRPFKLQTDYDQNVTFWVNPQSRFIRNPSTNEYVYGMYEVKLAPQLTGNDFTLISKSHSNMLAVQGGAIYDGFFHCSNGEEIFGMWFPYDFQFGINDNWNLYLMQDMGSPGFVADCMTFDPIRKKAYGSYCTPEGTYDWDLCEIDYTRLERKPLAKAQHRYAAMAIDRQGRWFGITALGDLYRISTTDGTETFIGSTGLPVSASELTGFYFQSGCFDYSSDTFYWARTDTEGKSAIYSVNTSTAEATLAAQLPDWTLIPYFTVVAGKSGNGTPGAVADLQADFAGASNSGSISFTMPNNSVDGIALTGPLYYDVEIDGEIAKQGSAASAASVTEEVSLADGMHRIDIVVKNSQGRGAMASTGVFVGLDTPDAPANASIDLVDGTAVVTWDASLGEFLGYPGELTYTVTRQPDNKLIADAISTTTITDQLPTGKVTRYSYTITASNGSAQSRVAATPGVAFGDVIAPPYYLLFQRGRMEDQFTIVDANNDGVSWEVSDYSSYIHFGYRHQMDGTFTMQPADDWMILPAISLEAGKTYQLTYEIMGTQRTDLAELEIKVGQGVKPEKLAHTVRTKSVVSNTSAFTYVTDEFTVSADGEYNVGFHACGARLCGHLYIRQIALECIGGDQAPSNVTDFVVGAGAGGAYNAIVIFNAPTKKRNGEPLTSLTSIRVIRDNRVLHVFQDPEPGQQLQFVDTSLTAEDNGNVQYVVVPTNGAGDGEMAVNQAFIGLDVPETTGMTGQVTDLGEGISIQWTPVSTRGVNGGYVDPQTTTYYVYEQLKSSFITLGVVTGDTSYVYNYDTSVGEQRAMGIAVGAVNTAGASPSATAIGQIIVGQAYQLPLHEAINTDAFTHFFWNETNCDEKPVFISDDTFHSDGYAFQWAGSALNNNYSLNTGKITLEGTSAPTLAFAYSFDRRGTITVRVQTPDGQTTDLQVIDAAEVETGQWHVAKVDLSDYIDQPYIIVKLLMQSNLRSHHIKIDDINVFDMPNYNLALDFFAPDEARTGRENDLSIVVKNMGDREMDNYTVRVFADDEEVFSQTIGEPLGTLEQNVVIAGYKPSVFSAGSHLTLRAEVEAARDRISEDNTKEAVVSIVSNDVPMPENLTATSGESAVLLRWDAPRNLERTITEDFEGDQFTDFSTGGIQRGTQAGRLGGGWTLFDGNNTLANSFDNIEYENKGARSAWVVFNTAAVEDCGITPHSGNKFIVSFDVLGAPSYNWLISPELSGQARTLHFFATEPAGSYKHETFEVLVSSTDNSVGTGSNAGYGDNTGSFTVIGQYATSGNGWDEFTVDLPEDTRYFAIRSTSQDAARLLCIDDISYTVMAGRLTGYNVYADQMLLATTDEAQTTYVVSNGNAAQYAVTAVYADGQESQPAVAGASLGMQSLTDADKAFDVYTIDGVKTRSSATSLEGLRKGVYIIRHQKVIVK